MNSINISKIDTCHQGWNDDILDGIIPMKTYYDTEFSKKIGSELRCQRDDERSMEIIFDELWFWYDFWVAKQIGEYVWFVSWILEWEKYENMATFVYPDYRRLGVAEKMLKAQISFAKSQWALTFQTSIDKVNIEAKGVVDKLWFKSEKLLNGWQVTLDL